MLKAVYLAGGVRTAIGSFSGALAEVPAPVLGSAVIRECLVRAGVEGTGDESPVEEVLFGNVLSAGLGQNVARQAALGAGLPPSVGAMTVNKVCGSSLKAVMLAAQAIQCGDAHVIVAGGTENMSAAPYLLPKARAGYRMGNGVLVDSMIKDGLWDAYNDVHMGGCGDACAERYQLSRETQDDFAVESYKRALAAAESGAFRKEIVAVEAPAGKGTVKVSEDEEPKRFNEDKLRQLRPAFSQEGTVTPGNASSINDGAAAVLVLDEDRLQALGVTPQARVVGYSTHSREPEWFTLAPIGAIEKLLRQLNWKAADVGLYEINEAFSCVPLSAMQDLGIPHDRLNVHGGAVALGHPIGASGARVLVTLLHAMAERDVATGIAALCIGGGEGVALAVERV